VGLEGEMTEIKVKKENVLAAFQNYCANEPDYTIEDVLKDLFPEAFEEPNIAKGLDKKEPDRDRNGNIYLIKIRTSQNAHAFINWEYSWREMPKLCKKAKEELVEQLLVLAEKVKREELEEKKEPEASELDGLISTFDASEFTEHRVFKQQIIDLAKKKVDECGEVFYGPSSGLMNKYTKGIKQKLEEM